MMTIAGGVFLGGLALVVVLNLIEGFMDPDP